MQYIQCAYISSIKTVSDEVLENRHVPFLFPYVVQFPCYRKDDRLFQMLCPRNNKHLLAKNLFLCMGQIKIDLIISSERNFASDGVLLNIKIFCKGFYSRSACTETGVLQNASTSRCHLLAQAKAMSNKLKNKGFASVR